MKYCAARNKAAKVTLHAKKKFKHSIAQNKQENPKTFWPYMYVRNKTKSRTGVADLKDKDGHTVPIDIEKANLLNDFFASVFTKEDTHQMSVFDLRYHPCCSYKRQTFLKN